MADRKEAPALQQPSHADIDTGSVNKFRRKLSHGFSFISNPLSQRKTTPVHPPLVLSSPSIDVDIQTQSVETPRDFDSVLFPVHDSRLFEDSGTSTPLPIPKNNIIAIGDNDSDETSRTPQLPRPRTMSLIPRPIRSVSGSSVVMKDRSTPKPCSPPFVFHFQSRVSTPSKIPSPPASKWRRSSPHQYMLRHATRQATDMTFTRTGDQSPSKSLVKSYTTPNLAKTQDSPQPGGFMRPPKSELQRKSSVSSGVQPPLLKENIPTYKRENHRVYQIGGYSMKRQCPVAPTVTATGRLFMPANSPRHSEQALQATPLSAESPPPSKKKDLAVLTSLIVRQTQPGKQNPLQVTSSNRYSKSSSITQTRLMGPVNPLTPRAIDQVVARSVLPQTITGKNLRWGAFTKTPSSDHNFGTQSCYVVDPNSKVRLPCSFMFFFLETS